jgi:hypothetical protein
MPRLGMYDHLEETDPINATISMAELASCLCRLNYGQQRLLSAIVRERKKNPYYGEPGRFRDHTDALEALLEGGFF